MAGMSRCSGVESGEDPGASRVRRSVHADRAPNTAKQRQKLKNSQAPGSCAAVSGRAAREKRLVARATCASQRPLRLLLTASHKPLRTSTRLCPQPDGGRRHLNAVGTKRLVQCVATSSYGDQRHRLAGAEIHRARQHPAEGGTLAGLSFSHPHVFLQRCDAAACWKSMLKM